MACKKIPMTSVFVKERYLPPECVKNISIALEICLDVFVNVKEDVEDITHTSTHSQTRKSLFTKTVPLLTPKKLYKANKRAFQVVTAQGYRGVERDLQYVLMQARRRIMLKGHI